MKTKQQKKEQIKAGEEKIAKSEIVVITDFTGLSANELNAFRRAVRGLGGVMMVMKKRLLKLAFAAKGIEIDTKKLDGQAGVVFSPKDIVETSGVVYNFGKPFAKKSIFKILGGFDVKAKKFIEGSEIKQIGQLPSKEVLLGQLAFMLTIPIKKLLFVMNEKGKKVAN
ncbi:MAG: 50S ribosomal protein L10 [Minisyncoccia bacterium]